MQVRKWETWQSYRKDRGTPPWIKVHRNLLSNPEWVSLSDAEKGQLVSIWILAADKNGQIPSDPALVQKMCMLDKKPNLNKFIQLKFLTSECQPSDVRVSTNQQQSDQPETETETETETEREKPQRKKRATSLTAEWMLPDDYREYCKSKRPDLCPDATAENFLDYYLSHGKPMVDWKRTWQRWVRNEHGTSRKAGNGTSNQVISTPAGRGKEALERVRRKDNEAALAADA